MTSIAAQQEQHIVSRPSTNGFYLVRRAVWWAGLALMIVINLYTSPQSEWTDRDKAVAAARQAAELLQVRPQRQSGLSRQSADKTAFSLAGVP